MSFLELGNHETKNYTYPSPTTNLYNRAKPKGAGLLRKPAKNHSAQNQSFCNKKVLIHKGRKLFIPPCSKIYARQVTYLQSKLFYINFKGHLMKIFLVKYHYRWATDNQFSDWLQKQSRKSEKTTGALLYMSCQNARGIRRQRTLHGFCATSS